MNSRVYNVHKSCAVPMCENTSKKHPDKLFIYVPNNKTVRNKWFNLARRDPTVYSLNTSIYFCEDHFDLPYDMENYIQYRVMGSVSQIRMKPGCIPTKFKCQPDRKKQTWNTTERLYIIKKQRKELIEESLRDFDERNNSTKHLELDETSMGNSSESTRENSCFTQFGHNTWDHTYATMDFPSTVCVKQEPETNESADVIKEELADVIKEEGGDEAAKEASGSEAAMLAALYADHVVKDELVLGPEVPYRPHITYLHDARGVSGGASREPRGGELALEDCSVRIEHCEAPPESRAPRDGTAPHTRTDHNAANTYVCDICGKIFKQRSDMIRHLNIHLRDKSKVLLKSNTCEICNKQLSRLDSLQRHRRVHTGEKPHSCEICQKKFAESGHLTIHKRIHTRDKPYSCDICKKQFTDLSTMKRHKTSAKCVSGHAQCRVP